MKSTEWETHALCADSGVDFFAEADLPEEPDSDQVAIAEFETQQALAICDSCPVRLQCMETALEGKFRFGVWGGADQTTIRKALSVNEYGEAVPRAKDMICPYCKSSKIEITVRRRNQTQINCNDCGLTWWAAKPLPMVAIKIRDVENFGKDVE